MNFHNRMYEQMNLLHHKNFPSFISKDVDIDNIIILCSSYFPSNYYNTDQEKNKAEYIIPLVIEDVQKILNNKHKKNVIGSFIKYYNPYDDPNYSSYSVYREVVLKKSKNKSLILINMIPFKLYNHIEINIETNNLANIHYDIHLSNIIKKHLKQNMIKFSFENTKNGSYKNNLCNVLSSQNKNMHCLQFEFNYDILAKSSFYFNFLFAFVQILDFLIKEKSTS